MVSIKRPTRNCTVRAEVMCLNDFSVTWSHSSGFPRREEEEKVEEEEEEEKEEETEKEEE